MGSISKLNAVNQMLLAAGEQIVADLSDGSGISTGIAEFILDQIILDIQMRGLASNVNLTKVTPDSTTKKITLGSDVISAELISHHTNDDGYVIVAVIRGAPNSQRLFNVTDQTEEFQVGTEYTLKQTYKLEWEELDTPLQRQIMGTAKRQYQMMIQGDGDADRMLAQDELIFSAKGRSQDIAKKKRNIMSSYGSMLKEAINRTGVSNDPSRYRFWRTK